MPPALIAAIATRSSLLGMKPGIYLSLLAHNDLAKAKPLALRKGRAKVEAVKRAPMSLSFPAELRKECTTRAAKAGGNFTAYLEHLANEDIEHGGPLVILLRE